MWKHLLQQCNIQYDILLFASVLLGSSSMAQYDTASRRRREGVVLIALLIEVLTSPSSGVLSDRGRRTRLEWRSQWRAHRSKTGKCQTLEHKAEFSICNPHVCWSYTSRVAAMNTNALFVTCAIGQEVQWGCQTHASYFIYSYYDAFKKYFPCYYITRWTWGFKENAILFDC